jgi:hypothetical protein
VALGAVVALRPVVKRRMVRKMRCKQMMGQLIGGSETTADAAMRPEAMPPKMREHCKRWPRSTSSGGSRRDGLAVVPEELSIRAS